jgi:hypothetical protein
VPVVRDHSHRCVGLNRMLCFLDKSNNYSCSGSRGPSTVEIYDKSWWNVAMVRKHESRLCSCNGVKELPHNACLQKMLCKFRMSYFLQEYSCILEIALNSESKPLVIKKMSPELDVVLSSL